MLGKLSIIIPAYNSESTLRKCVESVINQTYGNTEIVIVDDGSSDSTREVALMLSKEDHRIFVYSKENGGQASARNYGLTKATGDYITFVDDDDYIDFDMYETLIEAMKNNGVLVAGCGTCVEDETGNVLTTTKFGKTGIKNGIDVVYNILYGTKACWGTVWNKVFDASLKNKLVFPDGRELEDYWVILRLFVHLDRIYYCDKKMYHWIQRSSSQSHRLFHKNMFTTIEVINDVIKYFQSLGFQGRLINACYYYRETLLSSLVIRMWKSNDMEIKEKLRRKIKPLFLQNMKYGIRLKYMRLQHTKDFVHAFLICAFLCK